MVNSTGGNPAICEEAEDVRPRRWLSRPRNAFPFHSGRGVSATPRIGSPRALATASSSGYSELYSAVYSTSAVERAGTMTVNAVSVAETFDGS
jgi:hypothetical protein